MTEAPVKPTVDANMIALLRDRRFTMTGGSEFALEIVAALSRPPAAGQEPVPAVLFDGFAVYQALTDQARQRTSAENVADTLDAAVRLMRAALPQGNAPAGGMTQGEQQ